MTETPAPYSIEQQISQALADAYPEPSLGTKAEAIRAALKGYRTIERLKLSSREPSVTGKALPAFTVWLLDVWRLVDSLPYLEREVVMRYYMASRADSATYGNREIAAELGCSERYVAQLKRQGVARIEAALWPECA